MTRARTVWTLRKASSFEHPKGTEETSAAKTFELDTPESPSSLLARAMRAAHAHRAPVRRRASGRLSHELLKGEYHMAGSSPSNVIGSPRR